MKLQIKQSNSYKIGINEIVGLKDAMKEALKPVQAKLEDQIYWCDGIELRESEYKSRDGFIPHSHNCGGIEISEIIPSFERNNFDYLEFGECDLEECIAEHDSHCSVEEEGHLDAKLRIWLKFEGLTEDNKMQFYLYLGGGNGDAPYFRVNYETTIFETDFECKTIAGFKRIAKVKVAQMLKKMVLNYKIKNYIK